MSTSNADLDCPAGGAFYVCTSGSKFLGCCKSDPCSKGCPDDDLTGMSFDKDYNGSFPGQTCAKGKFYSCWYDDQSLSPFLGCCGENPCEEGQCHSENLYSARLSSDKDAKIFKSMIASSSTTTSHTSTVTSSKIASMTAVSAISSTRSSSSTTSTAVPSQATASGSGTGHSLSKGAIAGIAACGTIALIAIVAVVVALCTRRDKRALPHEKHGFLHVDNESTKRSPCLVGGNSTSVQNRTESIIEPQVVSADLLDTPNPNFSSSSSAPTTHSAPSPELQGLLVDAQLPSGHSRYTGTRTRLPSADGTPRTRLSELQGSSTESLYGSRTSLSMPRQEHEKSQLLRPGQPYRAYNPHI